MMYAKQGERITCENGHLICVVARDIEVGQMPERGKDLKDWQQPEPDVGTLAKDIKCAQCGAEWFGADVLDQLDLTEGRSLKLLSPMRFHFEDGWR
jgi:hypothetical protein